ncbi:MAG: 50S ribosomal protein L17 [Parcubacteria group bacterium CG11_big_fil_rev_8_21_14_0_20_39_22]|nr:MAG: 50S ribosomal protein L17 [Parcubacteria group bacterium CG11_big_fil_rev_8_21_14_0_20_39_22]
MRHANTNRKFGREKGQRQALLRSLIVSLIRDEKIKTTEAKAKELRPHIEKLITKAKTATIASRRLINGRIGNDSAAGRLVSVIAPKYKDRQGGYTRITKLPIRQSDGASMAVIEFV